MFDNIRNAHRLARILAIWKQTTGIDPGDQGQLSEKALEYIGNVGLSPEDAWLAALVNWISGMPWPDSKEMMARGLLYFLEECEDEISFSREPFRAAREVANEILS